jgi:ABC-2 type transport system permease protein
VRHRIGALVEKELADVRRHPGIFMPAIITGVMAIVMPFVVAIVIPLATGERLSDSADFRVALDLFRAQPQSQALGAEGAIQGWIFQQFLTLLALTPISASMSVAAYSVVGEKQARTLEPVLATPVTTFELILAKVLGSLVPGLVLTAACLVVYIGGVAALAEPGVYTLLLVPRALAMIGLVMPLASMAALELAVCVSSRATDARSAQQVGALVVLPLSGLLVAQLMGAVELTTARIVAMSLGLAAVDLALLVLGVRLFDRDTILTRWE